MIERTKFEDTALEILKALCKNPSSDMNRSTLVEKAVEMAKMFDKAVKQVAHEEYRDYVQSKIK